MTLADYLIGERSLPSVDLSPGIATPLRFTDPAAEHTATRHRAGLFDFSFMACFDVKGRDAPRFVERVQVRPLQTMAPGQLAYTLACREDGTVLNDATVWRRATNHYTLFTGRRADRAHLLECANGLDVGVRDVSAARATCAVQGPVALRLLRAVLPGHAWEALPYFHFRTVDFEGVTCDIARLGYSGEAGFELVADAHAAPRLWQRLTSAGVPLGLAECGFAAADALRIEAGFLLFSRELEQRVTPFEINLGRLVSRANARCIGADALAKARRRPPARCLVGLVTDSDAMPELAQTQAVALPGCAVLTSACLSPVSRGWIGLGFVTPEDQAPGTRIALEGGRRATVARLPFYDPMKVRPRRGWT